MAEDAWEVIDPHLYHKVICLHFFLASEEDMESMLEPTGWRPPLPSNMSLQMQAHILQGKLGARNRHPSPGRLRRRGDCHSERRRKETQRRRKETDKKETCLVLFGSEISRMSGRMWSL